VAKKSTLQWFVGIIIAIICLLVIWWFSDTNVISDPPAMKVTIIPEIKIIDDSLSVAQVNKKYPAVFTVYNNSDSAVDYSINWDAGTNNGKPVESARFRIEPHSTNSDTLVYPGFKNPGTFQTTLIVYVYLNDQPKFSTKYECEVRVVRAGSNEKKRKK
jgi:hypothetical protein